MHSVIDDFLPKDVFKRIQKSICFNDQWSWYFGGNVTYTDDVLDDTNDETYYVEGKQETVDLEHSNSNIYGSRILWNRKVQPWFLNNNITPDDLQIDPFVHIIKPLWDEINPDVGMMRVKVNFYPYVGPEIIEHQWHLDYEFPHWGGLYSLNTCDGYTMLSDGTKIDSIENRMLVFNAGDYHKSSTSTDSKGRFNINFNWI